MAFSQNYTQWFFGNHGALRFDPSGNATPTFPSNTNMFSGTEGCTIVNDNYGNPIFYSNGKQLWSSSQLLTDQLFGHQSATQSTLAVPIPSSSISNTYKFLLFCLKAVETPTSPYFSVCLVTVTASGSPVSYSVTPGTPLGVNSTVMSEKIAMTSDGSGGYWVIAHDYNEQGVEARTFYKYHITEANFAGVTTTSQAVTALNLTSVFSFQTIGADHKKPTNFNGHEYAQGQMKFDQQGTKLGLVISGKKIFEIFSFNKTTGMLSNVPLFSQEIYPCNGYLYGFEFSPLGNSFYVSQGQLINPNLPLRYLIKYDIIGTTLHTPYFLDWINDPNISNAFNALQLGPNNKIYVCDGRINEYLGVINSPDNLGSACGYDPTSQKIQGTSEFGLPSYLTINTSTTPPPPPPPGTCNCTVATTSSNIYEINKQRGSGKIDLILNSGTLVTYAISIEIVNFEIYIESNECKEYCNLNTANMGMFVFPVPKLLNREGQLTSIDPNIIAINSHEVTYNLTQAPQIIQNSHITLDVSFPFMKELSCCETNYRLTLRMSYYDNQCRVCQSLLYISGGPVK